MEPDPLPLDPVLRLLRGGPPPPSFGQPDVAALAEAGRALRSRRRQRLTAAGAAAGVLLLAAGLALALGGARPGDRRHTPTSLAVPTLADLHVGHLPTDPYPVSLDAGRCAQEGESEGLCWAPALTVARIGGSPDPAEVRLELKRGDARQFAIVAQRTPDTPGETKVTTTLSSGAHAVLETEPGVTEVFWLHDGQLLTALGQGIPVREVLQFAGSISDPS